MQEFLSASTKFDLGWLIHNKEAFWNKEDDMFKGNILFPLLYLIKCFIVYCILCIGTFDTFFNIWYNDGYLYTMINAVFSLDLT